jgi:hypothetical protein
MVKVAANTCIIDLRVVKAAANTHNEEVMERNNVKRRYS